jgi:hypothetical protein
VRGGAALDRREVTAARDRIDSFEDVGPVGGCRSEPLVAGIADPDTLDLPRGEGDRRRACLREENLHRRESLAVLTDLGQQFGGGDPADGREARKDERVGVHGEEVVDARVELADLVVQHLELIGQGNSREAVAVDAALRSRKQVGAQPADEHVDGDPTGIANTLTEPGHTGFPNSAGRLGRRIVPQERQRGVSVHAREEGHHRGVIGEERLAQLRLDHPLGLTALPTVAHHRPQLGMDDA